MNARVITQPHHATLYQRTADTLKVETVRCAFDHLELNRGSAVVPERQYVCLRCGGPLQACEAPPPQRCSPMPLSRKAHNRAGRKSALERLPRIFRAIMRIPGTSPPGSGVMQLSRWPTRLTNIPPSFFFNTSLKISTKCHTFPQSSCSCHNTRRWLKVELVTEFGKALQSCPVSV